MPRINELVINYHMTETCNYRCGYCFATWANAKARTELHRHPGKVKSLLENLASTFLADNPLQQETGYTSVRINFAGGEPMLLGQRFNSAITQAHTLGFRCSVITNGHFLDSEFIEETAKRLCLVGISYDTANPELQTDIGRCDRQNRSLSPRQVLEAISHLRAASPAMAVKINTVVNRLNWQDDMNAFIGAAAPDKWKVLRVLPVHDDDHTVTDHHFTTYCHRHRMHRGIMSVESNATMRQSYLMINPQGSFYSNRALRTGYDISPPIGEAGVPAALAAISFDTAAFARRYGRDASRFHLGPRDRRSRRTVLQP
jgi:radical S-adenosyl methionine domain-containing protein 2